MTQNAVRRARRALAPAVFPIFLVALLLIGVTTRLAVIHSGFVRMAPDSTGYWEPAKSLVEEQRYLVGGSPNAERPPTYPLFLALIILFVGPDAERALIVQIVVTAALGAGLALWLRSSGASRSAAIAAGLLVSIDPLLVAASGIVLSEALGAMLLTALVMALHSALTDGGRWWVLVGCLAGFLSLNTPNTVGLLPFLVVLQLVRKRALPIRLLLGSSLAVVLLVASLVPWILYMRTVVKDAKWGRSTGFTSLIWSMTEYPFNWVPDPDAPEAVKLTERFKEISGGRGLQELNEVQGKFLREAWKNFRERPFQILGRVMKANFWFWAEIPGAVRLVRPYPWLRWSLLAFHQVQLLAFVLGAWVLVRRGLSEYAFLAMGCVAYFALSLMLMFPIPRYYVLVLPMMDLIAATGLAEWWRLRGGIPSGRAPA